MRGWPRPHGQSRSSTSARSRDRKPDERARLPLEVGVDELARRARRPLEHAVGLGVDELGDEQVGRREVEPVARLALRAERRPDLTEPVGIGDARAPGRLDPPAELGDVAARLAAGDEREQPEARRVEPLRDRALGEVVRVRRDREHPGRPQRREEVEQPVALPEPDRDDGRAGRLQRHVVGDPARIERVVDAVEDRVVRRDPRRTKGPGARERRPLEVAAREPDQQRRPGRPGGDVEPDDLLLRDAGERPERRVLRLRREQLRLGHERLLGELGERRAGRAVRGRTATRARTRSICPGSARPWSASCSANERHSTSSMSRL